MITFIESFARELEMEAAGTVKMLALVPADKLTWKPHPKSMAMKMLATHVAEIPGWVDTAVKTSELDMAKTPYSPRDCNTGEELVAYYKSNVAGALETLKGVKDSILDDSWTMRNGDQVYFTMSKLDVIRHSLCQLVHHRAQLGVYLRLLDIPIPGVYGPSADDQGKM